MDESVRIVAANLTDPAHAAALVEMLDWYMRDPMEGGEPPGERIKRDLVPGLLAHPAHYVFLAFRGAEPVGFAICFLGFSTFNARPLINIHDIFVRADLRGQRIGRRLLDRIEEHARALNCCRLTLEVREDNRPARALYRRVGFGRVKVGAARVPLEFWQKILG